GTLYAATGKVYRSEDAGESWEGFLELAPREELEDACLAVTPSGSVFAGRRAPWGGGLFRSPNGRDGWVRVLDRPVNDVAIARGRAVYVAPSGAGLPKVLRSADNGATWFADDEGLSSSGVVMQLTMGKATTLYGLVEGGGGGSLYRKELPHFDPFEWTPFGTEVGYVATMVESGGVLYTATSDGVFRRNLSAGSAEGWESAGLEGRRVNDVFAWSVSSSVTLYAAIELSAPGLDQVSLYKSTDRGASWRPADSGMRGRSVRAVEGCPSNPSVLYAAGLAGILRSDDGGSIWTALPISAQPEINKVSEIVVDPSDPDIFYFGGMTNYYLHPIFGKSRDGGQTDVAPARGWCFAHDPIISDMNAVHLIVLDPLNSETVYVGLVGAIYRTPNWGATNVTSAVPSSVAAVAFDPTDSNHIYLGLGLRTPEGVTLLETWDAAETWVAIAGPDEALGISDLVWDPIQPDVLYAATYGSGVYKGTSRDTPTPTPTATPTPTPPYPIGEDGWTTFGLQETSVGFLIQSGDLLYAGTYKGVFRRDLASDDGWTSWGLQGKRVADIYVDPVSSATLYAAIKLPRDSYAPPDEVTLYKSTDGGATWLPSDNGMHGWSVYAVEGRPDDPSVLYAATAWEVLLTDNAGTTWSAVYQMGTSRIDEIAIDPTTPDTIYVGGQSGFWNAVFEKSTDGGKTFAVIRVPRQGFHEGDTISSIALDPTDTQILYATGFEDPVIYKSVDGGETGALLAVADDGSDAVLRSIVIDPDQRERLYAGGSRYLYRIRDRDSVPLFHSLVLFGSRDGGESWREFGGGPEEETGVSIMVLDKRSSDVLYIGTWTGVYRLDLPLLKTATPSPTPSATGTPTAPVTATPTPSATPTPEPPAPTPTETPTAAAATPTPTPDDDHDAAVRAMVTWFYETILGREPEPGAVDAWHYGYFHHAIDLNIDVRFAASEMARIFFLSEEYAARGRTNAEFLGDCYQVFLSRAPSQTELDNWLGGTWNRSQVVTVFSESEEFATRIEGLYPGYGGDAARNFVTFMYIGLLDRLVDRDGLEWATGLFDASFASGGLEAVRAQAKQMAREVIVSAEFLSKGPTTADCVVRFYRAFLGRFPSNTEVTYWSGELDSGRHATDTLIDLFGDAPEFTARLSRRFGG
ncbi:MAG TPA: DUF4214 domain-containing protein, partial [Sumerlaeia bacterium]|nr:DUF4214 domain-containing protein [Sumerlaeia bacterium]